LNGHSLRRHCQKIFLTLLLSTEGPTISRELIAVSEKRADSATARLGMWLFLASEVLIFGGLFIIYASALKRYPHEFHTAAKEMNTLFGGSNTVILLTSSFFVALSVAFLKKGQKLLSSRFLIGTVLFACAFLGNKYIEWGEKIHHGIYPNAQTLLTLPKGEILFFDLYYIMTGLHGLHVLIGIVLFIVAIFFIRADRINNKKPIFLENCGLYWHLVDIIWIYLFPLFYLIT
jgi:cytochrome c oxidase subunit 3